MDNLASDYSESDEADDEAEVPESSDSEQSDLLLSSDEDGEEDDIHFFSDDDNAREDLQPRKSCDDELDDDNDEEWLSWVQSKCNQSPTCEEPPAVNDSGSDDEIVVRKDGAGRTYNRRRQKQLRPPRPPPKLDQLWILHRRDQMKKNKSRKSDHPVKEEGP